MNAYANDLVEAVVYGNAAGVMAVTKLGAQTSLPTKAEVNDFMAKERNTLQT